MKTTLLILSVLLAPISSWAQELQLNVGQCVSYEAGLLPLKVVEAKAFVYAETTSMLPGCFTYTGGSGDFGRLTTPKTSEKIAIETAVGAVTETTRTPISIADISNAVDQARSQLPRLCTKRVRVSIEITYNTAERAEPYKTTLYLLTDKSGRYYVDGPAKEYIDSDVINLVPDFGQ